MLVNPLLHGNGCKHHDNCCPFSQCIYDVPDGQQRKLVTEARNNTIRVMHQDGKDAQEIAVAVGLSLRSIYRILQAW